MNSIESRRSQIEKYRQMSGNERLMIGLRLHVLSCEIARDQIKASQSKASSEEVAQTPEESPSLPMPSRRREE